jgi:hypothetical protein
MLKPARCKGWRLRSGASTHVPVMRAPACRIIAHLNGEISLAGAEQPSDTCRYAKGN